MRTIKSSRKGKEPVHTHYCPWVEHRIDKDKCGACRYWVALERKPVSYEIVCRWAPSGPQRPLKQFKPAKAYDRNALPGYMGNDPLLVPTASWLEIKRDGARCLVHFTTDGVRCTGRRKNRQGDYSEFTDNVPHIRDMSFSLPLVGVVMDCELVLEATGDSTGSLGATMSVVGSKPANALRVQEQFGKAQLYAFDLVFDPDDCRDLSQATRRAGLEWLLTTYSMEFINLIEGRSLMNVADRRAFFQQALAKGHEGLVAKDPSAKYGARYAWLKVKQTVAVCALVTGFDLGAPGSKYAETVGALWFSVMDAKTSQLREIGKVVPGSDETRRQLIAQFNESSDIASLGIQIEVEGQSWTKAYRLRHPRILRYWTDKNSIDSIDFSSIVRR